MKLIRASWPVKPTIHALTTTRMDGVSQPPYDGLNFAYHVGDDPLLVEQNRQILQQAMGLKKPVQWLEQVHGTAVVKASDDDCPLAADACWSDEPGMACAVMTADCLPVLFTDRAGTRVAAAHAGWRGLANGVLENTLAVFANPADVMVWLGPAIGPLAFEVGDDVFLAFCEDNPLASAAFIQAPTNPGKWLADIYRLARIRLAAAGVTEVYGGDFCTFTDSEYFYSYRRDNQTGRMASLIWIDGE
ncbi:peptidoglycan editing factor PgeF [Nitrincola iocasae]|uniref:Purine nucleoside phosphorylase n=1 Tax=Nitrincola iocasae TaxID=2614693 RepID=A0A5J6LA44_9GAMM|nr:peptidoglycan editing factor PgeF [Nitrincola iocasae]QEW05350.1 peptidoglycan editing factor PgeF [Nitrincola iocasae]